MNKGMGNFTGQGMLLCLCCLPRCWRFSPHSYLSCLYYTERWIRSNSLSHSLLAPQAMGGSGGITALLVIVPSVELPPHSRQDACLERQARFPAHSQPHADFYPESLGTWRQNNAGLNGFFSASSLFCSVANSGD